MTHQALGIALCLLAAATASASGAQGVRVVVRVPEATPAEPVYIAGSLASVGSWSADGAKLGRQADGTYAAELRLEVGQTLQFKITRGSWETVEKRADGGERENRTLTVDASTRQVEVVVERWSAGDVRPANSVVGTLQLHTIDSRALGKPRTIRVWLPPGYDASGGERYDVLYMHDGQNCFDRATSAFGNEWQIDETLTTLIAEKKLRPILVVGIDNGGAERINEMTYASDAEHRGGKGATYAKFLLGEVMPLVQKTYRVHAGPAHAFLGGSSLGGLASLEIARRHPDTFGGVIAMSPSLWWPGEPIIAAIEQDAGGLRASRLWLDMSSREAGSAKDASYVDDAKRLDAALTKQGVEHRLLIEPDAAHNEQAWARRFPEAIRYLLAR